MADENYIHEGIPLRVGATRCVLGTLRSDPDTVEATNETTDYEQVTGCSPRNPKHEILTDDTDDKVTQMGCWLSYPAKLPQSLENPDTHLVIKARGPLTLDDEGEWILPKITLTLRPLKSALDYKWVRDFTSQMPVAPVYWYGAENKHSTYAENSDGEMVVNDFVINYDYYGETHPPATLVSNGDGRWIPSDTYYAGIDGYYTNQRIAASVFDETGAGSPMYLKADFYWKTEDKPSTIPSHYAPPLQPEEIDLTLYPRAEGEEAYDFKRNESWDLRYRFPYWWQTRGGYPWLNTDRDKYIWNAPTDSMLDNPFNQSFFIGGLPETLVPVGKFMRVRDPSAFPISIGTDPREKFYKIRNLFALKQIESCTKIRKRYPYSFSIYPALYNRRIVSVIDWNPENYSEYEEPPFGESTTYTKGTSYDQYTVTYPAEKDPPWGIEEAAPHYKCDSWWRMEIELNKCEWNFSESLDKGWKIKGIIKYGSKQVIGTASEAPNYNLGWRWTGEGQISPFNQNNPTSNYYIRNGIWMNQCFGFNSNTDEPDSFEDAGQTEFEVEVTTRNAKGKKIKVLDFPIGGKAIAPWNEEEVQFGNEPNSSINFITDFYITEIIPPSAE